jgi:uncharacterized membrane protein YbjE (DUF340 family)
MTIILGLMLIGIVTGLFLEKLPSLVKINEKLLNLAIYCLLLLLGIAVGSNGKIIANIYSLGFHALVLTIGAITGSVLVCWLIYKIFFNVKLSSQDLKTPSDHEN